MACRRDYTGFRAPTGSSYSKISFTPSEAAHVIGEVMSFLSDRPEEFVCRSHRSLQAEGVPNSEIYVRLQDELAHWRFRAPDYTERQIRRLIYG